MKQNLLVTSYDYDVSKRLAEKLAEAFSMRVLNQIELFEFDHIPFSFIEVLEKNGLEYVVKEMNSIIKMELDFDDTVFVASINFADTMEDLFYKIKLSNFVILLKKNIEDEIKELSDKKYDTAVQKEFFNTSKEDLIRRKSIIEQNCADIVVDISDLTIEQIVQKIIDKIKSYYSVN